jgi:hypothetical protein
MIAQMEQANMRQFQPHLILFPELLPFYLSKFDKDIAFNQDEVRKLIRQMILERRQGLKENA